VRQVILHNFTNLYTLVNKRGVTPPPLPASLPVREYLLCSPHATVPKPHNLNPEP
jgi:hypothetical protein